MRRNASSFIFHSASDFSWRPGDLHGGKRRGADHDHNDRWSRFYGRCCFCYYAGTAAPPAPLTTPSVTGPLQWLPPAMFDAGPLGKIAANGIVTGSGLVQSNHVPGDDDGQAAFSNGQIFIQKADGKFQYFIQAGAYTLPSLATAFLPADKTVSNFYGALPVAFGKVQAGKTHAIPDRLSAYADGRRVHLHVPEHEH